MGGFFISAEHLWNQIITGNAPCLFDVRRKQAVSADIRTLPGARWCSHTDILNVCQTQPPGTPVVVNCLHGQNVSQMAAASLRAEGREAYVLAGGIAGWLEAGLPTRANSKLAAVDTGPSRWIAPIEMDRHLLASAWLVTRFIDASASFTFAETGWTSDIAEEQAINLLPAFDELLAAFDITDATLEKLAEHLRGRESGLSAGLNAALHGALLTSKTEQEAVQAGRKAMDMVHAHMRHGAHAQPGWMPNTI